MKHSLLILAILLCFTECKKDKPVSYIFGTVQQQGGCNAGSWLVFIPGPDAGRYSFICPSPMAFSSLNCTNSIYITNLPTPFAQNGKKIKFSKWTDSGVGCSSSSYAPHILEVSDISAQ